MRIKLLREQQIQTHTNDQDMNNKNGISKIEHNNREGSESLAHLSLCKFFYVTFKSNKKQGVL